MTALGMLLELLLFVMLAKEHSDAYTLKWCEYLPIVEHQQISGETHPGNIASEDWCSELPHAYAHCDDIQGSGRTHLEL